MVMKGQIMQKELIKWYSKNKRDLPWRKNQDPYKVWLSEVMLQQTQVATVIDYFNRFIEAYPTVFDLAKAKEDDVLKLWEGLGYYSRARRLIPCAKVVVDEYKGEFPRVLKDILKLPGIGSYTAGAVLSIAYNMKEPAVDGNVMRVYSRYFNMADDISSAQSKKVFEEKVRSTLPEDISDYNQGLMELGATICKPKQYRCDICPIAAGCEAKRLNLQDIRPVKTKKVKKRHEKIVTCMVFCDDLVMIVKRPNEGLLAGLWAFPTTLNISEEATKAFLKDEFDLDIISMKAVSTTKHVFTHLVWDMTLYEMTVDHYSTVDFPENKWIKEEELSQYALPKGYHKLLGNRKKC